MKTRVLFAGYAPVHLLCFQPVYEQLVEDSRIEVTLSGGLRVKSDLGTRYDTRAMYDRLAVDPAHVMDFAAARERDYDVTVCAHTSAGMLPRGPGRTVQIFHGVSFKNFAVREKVLRYDLLCLPGPYHARRFREQGLVRPGGMRCLLTGFPKADRLVEGDFDRDRFLRTAGVDPQRPTVLFAPTGGKHNSLETMGEAIVETIRDDGRFNLLIKPHDHPKKSIDWFARLRPLVNDRIAAVRDLDVIDFLRASDLLLTDASSVAVEYTLLDRPVVFVDVPKLLKNVIDRGAPLDLTTHGRKIGRVGKTPQQVLDAIVAGLREPSAQSQARRAMAQDVFHRPGTAAERVAGVVRWAAGLDEELPPAVETLGHETA